MPNKLKVWILFYYFWANRNSYSYYERKLNHSVGNAIDQLQKVFAKFYVKVGQTKFIFILRKETEFHSTGNATDQLQKVLCKIHVKVGQIKKKRIDTLLLPKKMINFILVRQPIFCSYVTCIVPFYFNGNDVTSLVMQGKDTLKRIFQGKVFKCESRDFLPVLYSGGGRDGLNRRIKRNYVGKHVWGLPRRTLGTSSFNPNDV